MNEETARQICSWSPMMQSYLAINLVLLVLLGVSLAFIEWSLDSPPFVMAVLGTVVVVGSIVLFGALMIWCEQYRGVRTVGDVGDVGKEE